MHVLIPDRASPGAASAARGLEEAGHVVHSCETRSNGHCVAIRGGRCPLEVAPIDLVVLVRASAAAEVLPEEMGALCGARRRVPVIVAGAGDASPYGSIATIEDETDDVVALVETVGALPLPDHTVAANRALHAAMAKRGATDGRATARVYRDRGRLAARLHFDRASAAGEDAKAAAVRVHAALRELDPWAAGVDVSVEPAIPPLPRKVHVHPAAADAEAY
jgi:hypothetical protein